MHVLTESTTVLILYKSNTSMYFTFTSKNYPNMF